MISSIKKDSDKYTSSVFEEMCNDGNTFRIISQICVNEMAELDITDGIIRTRYIMHNRGIWRESIMPTTLQQIIHKQRLMLGHYIAKLSILAKEKKSIALRARYLNDQYKDIKEEDTMVGRRVVEKKITEKSNRFSKRIDTKIDRLLSRTETKIIKKLKTHFGIEFVVSNNVNTELIQFNNWLKKYDKKFLDHILDPNKMSENVRVFTTSVSEEFIVKLEYGTYLYVAPLSYTGNLVGYANAPANHKSSSVYVYIFGKKCMKYAKELSKFLEEAPNTNNTGLLYTVSARSEDNWSCICQDINMRSFDNLFFEDDIKNAIINHLENWKSNESIYLSRDIMFKTGILLYGKAGTGKSSMATAIAKYMNCNIITVDLNTFDKLDIASFVSAINADKTRYVVLLDEIDTIFTSRENTESSETQTSNTMKLLSLLDSPQSPNNVIFVATTNYIDRLDDALTRKGRFDLKLKLSNLSDHTANKMCESFNLTTTQINEAKHRAGGGPNYNPAILQDCILNVIRKK